MTLLEAVLATVILSVVAIACLEGTREATGLQQRTREVSRAMAQAESELARAIAGAPPSAGVTVTRRPYAGAMQLEVVDVTVPLAGGGTTRLSRLAARDVAEVR
jgi:type II secretory pathway component PulJ